MTKKYFLYAAVLATGILAGCASPRIVTDEQGSNKKKTRIDLSKYIGQQQKTFGTTYVRIPQRNYLQARQGGMQLFQERKKRKTLLDELDITTYKNPLARNKEEGGSVRVRGLGELFNTPRLNIFNNLEIGLDTWGDEDPDRAIFSLRWNPPILTKK